jgi:hypothetical protein
VNVAETLLWPLKLTPRGFRKNRAPNHQIFKSLVSSLRERGTFQQSAKSFINPTITHDINQARVLNLVENNPHIGSREISSQIGISKSSVLRILKKHEYHPYHTELHNLHYWEIQNPHWMREQDIKNRWSLNVWGGVVNNRIVGPFFF